jgi:hypothetical protein
VKSIARWRRVAASLLLLAGCGGGSVNGDAATNGDTSPNGDGGPTDQVVQEPMPVDTAGNMDATVVEGGTCNAIIQNHPSEGAAHIPCTMPASYLTEPPSSGSHYPSWAAYQTYAAPIPWGNLVHNLEHGAIVIVYNCPQGCIDELVRAQAWIDGLPADPSCAGLPHRIILAPDPTLSVRFAASAWLWTLRSDCFDEAAFTTFYTDHYSKAPETVCSSGFSTLTDLCPP